MTRHDDDADPIDTGRRRSSPLASWSVREHVARGVAGLMLVGLAIVLLAVVGPLSLLLLAPAVLAWRGCPTCWAVGLLGTLADDRARRDRRACPVPRTGRPSR